MEHTLIDLFHTIFPMMAEQTSRNILTKFIIISLFTLVPIMYSTIHLLSHLQDMMIPLLLDGCKGLAETSLARAKEKYDSIKDQIK